MNPEIQKKLDSLKKEFTQDLRPEYILPYLEEFKVLIRAEADAIVRLTSNEERVDELFEILKQKSLKELQKFADVLNMEDECGFNYPWLGEKLNFIQSYLTKNELNRSFDINLNDILIKGDVPFKINGYYPRAKKITDIQSKLIVASAEKRYWVFLHGMSGTGKSVLAAECIRDYDLIKDCFPDGVFWIPVGRLKDDNLLISRMKRLFKLMNAEDKCKLNHEVSELKFNLKQLVASKKVLVVLIDVWKSNSTTSVLDAFDIGCPILVTTKFTLYEKYSDSSSVVQCKNDFTIDESRKFLANRLNCDINDLPPEADKVCRKCKGSPFILGHIGNLLASDKNGTNQWKNLEKLLKSRHISAKLGLDLKDIITFVHQTFDLYPLKQYKDLFCDFVIFPEDDGTFIPAEVFTILWDDKEGLYTNTVLHCLTQASLIQKHNIEDFEYCVYSIHHLYLEVLQDICKDTKGVRHQKLINSYLKLCKTKQDSYDFGMLPKDNYIHRNIAFHLEQLNNFNLEVEGNVTIDDIFFNLKFIEAKVNLDPNDLWVDYENYSSLFENKEQLKIYKDFARKIISKKTIMSENQELDVIQWALFEPVNSPIYKEALAIVATSNNKLYFEWCNQDENDSHVENLNSEFRSLPCMIHAAISLDGNLIACVVDGGGRLCSNVSIFSEKSNFEVLVLTGHRDMINYCCFDPSSSFLASASDDTFVKLFEIPDKVYDKQLPRKSSSVTDIGHRDPSSPVKDISNFTFMEHYSEVVCCNFSPNGRLIASIDVDGHIIVWQKQGHVKFSQSHHSLGNQSSRRNYCNFNFDGKLLSTSVYDSIKIWDVDEGTVLKNISNMTDIIIEGVCISNTHIVSVANNIIYMNRIDEPKKFTTFVFPRDVVITSFCLSMDQKKLACGMSDGSVALFLVNGYSLKRISHFKGHRSAVLCVMFNEDGLRLLSASDAGYIVHRVAGDRSISLVNFHGDLSVRKSGDELFIACSNSSNSIEIRKGLAAKLHCQSYPDDDDITSVSLSNDCKEVIYGTKSGSIKVFDIEDVSVTVLPEHREQINYITHSNTDLFFTCSEDRTIRVWQKDKTFAELKGHAGSVVMCVPFKKSDRLLSCSKDGTLRVWGIVKNELLALAEGHGNQDIRFCDLSNDETLMASASADKTVKIYTTENGVIYKFCNFDTEVKCCRFSPTFQVLTTGLDSGKVVFWSFGRNKNPIERHGSHQSNVYNLCYNRDGTQCLSIADEIKIWEDDLHEPQTLLLPSSYMGIARPSIWVSDTFDLIVVIHESVLYVLQKINNTITNVSSRL